MHVSAQDYLNHIVSDDGHLPRLGFAANIARIPTSLELKYAHVTHALLELADSRVEPVESR